MKNNAAAGEVTKLVTGIGNRGGYRILCWGGGHGWEWGRPPPNLPGCLGKRSKHHHPRPKTLATGGFVFALLEIIKHVFTDTND